MTYDESDRVSNITNSFSYSQNGADIIETHVRTYSYSNNGRISGYTISGDFTSNTIYNYDVLDRLSSVVYNNIVGNYSCTISKSYSYLNSPTYGETSLVETFTSTVGDTTVMHTYTYDDSGNITKITYSDGRVIEYEYDNLGQLISEDNDVTNEYCTYTYDNAGNLVETISQSKDTEETTEIVQNSYSYTDSEWGDLLTAFNGTALTYDEIGNPLSYYNGSSYTFGWEGRRLVSASINGKNISFTYNEDGLRTSKTVDGVTRYYVYDGSLLISEYTNDETLVYIYDANNEPIGFKYCKTTATSSTWYTFWYEKNLQGDIISICAKNGMKIVTYKYNTWGEPSIESYRSTGALKAMRNNLKYRGYYYDSDLDMYYLQSRYYDPNTCRFISPDDVSCIGANGDFTSYNLFAYCSNKPIMNKQISIFSTKSLTNPNGAIYSHTNGTVNLNVVKPTGAISSSSVSNKNHLFGYELRTSEGWMNSSDAMKYFFGIFGPVSYITHTQGRSGVLYAFAGSIGDITNWNEIVYYAGVGVNLFDFIGVEMQVETLGIGAQLSLGRFSVGANVNLIGSSTITIGWDTDLGDGLTLTDGFTIGTNTGLLLVVFITIYGFITTGDASHIPNLIPQLAIGG